MAGWATAHVNLADLVLDARNPRIDLKPSSTQAEIRSYLLAHEDVADLAHGLNESEGVLVGERIIIVNEGGHHVVLEGNRRVCALQMLTDPDLVPASLKATFPKASKATETNLREPLEADVAPDRDAAQPVITRRHTQTGVMPWTPQAQGRRVATLLKEGKTLDQIARLFGVSRTKVTKVLRGLKLLEGLKANPLLTAAECKHLADPKLEPTAFTRFFELKGGKEPLGLTFDEAGHFDSTLPKKVLNTAMAKLARTFLLPGRPTNEEGEPLYNTRSKPAEVYSAVLSDVPDLKKATSSVPAENPSASARVRTTAVSKIDKFFRGMPSKVQDANLFRLANEISRIDHVKFPTASAFLVRALIEAALRYSITRAKKFQDFVRDAKASSNIPSTNRDPGLEYMLNWCIQNQADLFIGNASRALSHWKKHKNILDMVVHGKWWLASQVTLEDAASGIRSFVERVIDGSALKAHP